jgi:hypothetical protein
VFSRGGNGGNEPLFEVRGGDRQVQKWGTCLSLSAEDEMMKNKKNTL